MSTLLKKAKQKTTQEWTVGVLNALRSSEGAIVLCRKDGKNFVALHGLSSFDAVDLLLDLFENVPVVCNLVMLSLADGIAVVAHG